MAWECSKDTHRCPACNIGVLRHTGYTMVADNPAAPDGLMFTNWRWNEMWQCGDSYHGFEIRHINSVENHYTDDEFYTFITQGKNTPDSEPTDSYFSS